MKKPARITLRRFLNRTATILVFLAIIPAPGLAALADTPPNVIIIFTDDQGYGDLGCYGSPLIRTPHLDRMAREGRRFTSFYSANSVCSPSRAALLTGCYPTRVSVPDVLWPNSSHGLHPDEITIADLLKERGYATTCIGKWHLGDKPHMLPTRQGFDSYFGIPFSNDMFIDPGMNLAGDILLREGMTVERIRKEKPQDDWVPLMRDEEVVEYPCDQTTLTRRYTEEAVKFIRANRSKPFFIYLPHTMPHIPLFASDKFKGTSERGLYGDVIEEIDWGVGEILNVLKELELDERTLVIFTSDNGPWDLSDGRGGSAGPLRGYKFETYEGGMRVPCIMRWPGKIPANTVSFEVAGTIDLLPTIARLAGAGVPDDRVIDGKDIWPLMSGTADARTPHDAYFYYQGNQLEAVRSGNWKLRRVGAAELQSVQEKASQLKDLAPKHRELIRRVVDKFGNVNEVQLFNLQQDVSETRNLADKHPDIVRRLIDTMNRFDRDLKANARPAVQREEE